MSTRLLICDDSNMARKQVARSLPDDWEVEISFAHDGVDAIKAIKEGKGDVLLLDLNMPNMDGYQVLEEIIKQDLPSLVVVISGDIQPEAHKRVISMGALDFIKKPVSKEKLTDILLAYGIFTRKKKTVVETLENTNKVIAPVISPISNEHSVKAYVPKMTIPESIAINFESTLTDDSYILTSAMRDCYQEISNVAMGRAGDLLARLLDVFVVLPIPNVNFIEVSELRMALSAIESRESTSGVCQGFISAGISGEALLILNDSGFQDIASLMNYEGQIDTSSELELLMDLANVLIGACLNGISEQLDIKFSQGHPVVLGQHRRVSDLIASNANKWKKTLAIEITYNIENYNVKCDLLLLFTEKSMEALNNKISYLLD